MEAPEWLPDIERLSFDFGPVDSECGGFNCHVHELNSGPCILPVGKLKVWGFMFGVGDLHALVLAGAFGVR